jgi:regulator of replication initiation timing
VRIPALFLSLALCFPAAPRLLAQVPDPGAQQDAEAAREKLLKSEDELDNIQANSEATKTSVDGMKTDVATLQSQVTALQADNAALKQQLADMQTAFDQYKAEQAQSRQTLIDNVAAMIAAGKTPATKKKKKETTPTEASVSAETSAIPSSLSPPPDAAPSPSTSAQTEENPAPPIKPQKGYYHVVAAGETLTMICTAYRDNGVNVTVSEVRKANGLTETSVLKTGQKIFIPKPEPNL